MYELLDDAGAALYVGITANLPARLRLHASRRAWWSDVADVRSRRYSDRETARRVEAERIDALDPRHNVDGSPTHEPAQVYGWSRAAIERARNRDPGDPDALLDVAAVAERLGWASVRTAYSARCQGRMPEPDTFDGRRPLWRAATVDAWDRTRKGLDKVSCWRCWAVLIARTDGTHVAPGEQLDRCPAPAAAGGPHSPTTGARPADALDVVP